MNLNFHKYLTFKNVVIFISWFIPFFFALKTVILGEVPFWYDPARDMLLAIDNLAKPTLIGAPSGIPGVFYGPYWIWIQSLGLLVSKNPRIVELLALTIPYFIFFPLLLYKITKEWGWKVYVIVWLLFILGFNSYTVQLWSPNLAPLILLLLTYVISKSFKKYKTLKPVFAGFIAGSLFSFHISIGVGVIIGTLLFFMFEGISLVKAKTPKEILKIFTSPILAMIGLMLAFMPFLIFEIRHQFLQTNYLILGFSGNLPIPYQGLSKQDVIKGFLERGLSFFHTDLNMSIFIFLSLLVVFILKFSKRGIKMERGEKEIVLLTSTAIISILVIYLRAKNPIWSYHFLTLEVMFLILFGFLISRISLIKNLALIIVLVLLFNSTLNFVKTFKYPNYDFPNLNTKEHVADTILKDGGEKKFSILVYDPAIYAYDYRYIFEVEKGLKDFNIKRHIETIYLIGGTKDIFDFAEYKTPSSEYKTVRKWDIPDGTIILKREKINE